MIIISITIIIIFNFIVFNSIKTLLTIISIVKNISEPIFNEKFSIIISKKKLYYNQPKVEF